MKRNRAIIVVTSHENLGDTGRKTGYYLPEVSHPYVILKNAGYVIEFASPKGGLAPMDPKSRDLTDLDNVALLDDSDGMHKLENTIPSSSIKAENYDLILFAGGLGTMWDFASDKNLSSAAAAVYDAGGIVAAVCHGPAALLNVTLKDGSLLIKGRRVAGFTNDEEVAAGNTDILPFFLETALRDRGALHTKAPLWQSHVEVSDRLVTGQNPASARAVAEAVVKVALQTR